MARTYQDIDGDRDSICKVTLEPYVLVHVIN